ncbi:hypothetical protein LWI28_024430 [Acer negundo]|uniref:Uncharacterized protein n=1 Tax=Acer negundo TaxID=4023 RepID=A0AAD5J6M2_ACENE|nr:hypothetical protein LWI28_024430 [Acer negundo]
MSPHRHVVMLKCNKDDKIDDLKKLVAAQTKTTELSQGLRFTFGGRERIEWLTEDPKLEKCRERCVVWCTGVRKTLMSR